MPFPFAGMIGAVPIRDWSGKNEREGCDFESHRISLAGDRGFEPLRASADETDSIDLSPGDLLRNFLYIAAAKVLRRGVLCPTVLKDPLWISSTGPFPIACFRFDAGPCASWIGDAQDFAGHRLYIHQNPVMGKLVANPAEYRYCSAFPGFKRDTWPPSG
jgi:hypothetical protein